MAHRLVLLLVVVADLLNLCQGHGSHQARGNRPARALRFSWDTLPVFAHGSNSTGPVNKGAIELLARFSVVTIEKFQGECANSGSPGPQCQQEAAITDVLQRVRMINPDVTTLFYYNSVINFKQYAWDGDGFPQAQLLRNSSGDLITVEHNGPVSVFDFGQAAARAEFIAECANATNSGWVDGCFVDRVMDGSPCCIDAVGTAATSGAGGWKCAEPSSPLTAAQCLAYDQGHMDVVSNLTAAIAPGPIIANHAFTTATDLYPDLNITGSMTESLPADESGISMLQWHAERGLAIEAHVGDCEPPGPGRTTVLAHFLIGAGRLAYFGCGAWSSSSDSWDDRWFEEFSRPLGPPVADAVKDNSTGVWTRSFDGVHGRTNVSWSASTGGSIQWAGFPAPPPPPPPQPTRQCPSIETNCAVDGKSGGPVGFSVAAWQHCCDICNKHAGSARADPCTAYRWTSVSRDGCTLYTGNVTLIGGGPAGSVCGKMARQYK
jgi:hypothetical protein